MLFVSFLQDIKKFKLGLHYALSFYCSLQQRQSSNGSSTVAEAQAVATGRGQQRTAGTATANGVNGVNNARRGSAGGMSRSEGWGAEPAQLEQWMLSLMLGYVSKVLQEEGTAEQQEQKQQLQLQHHQMLAGWQADGTLQASKAVWQAAQAAVYLCILLNKPQVRTVCTRALCDWHVDCIAFVQLICRIACTLTKSQSEKQNNVRFTHWGMYHLSRRQSHKVFLVGLCK